MMRMLLFLACFLFSVIPAYADFSTCTDGDPHPNVDIAFWKLDGYNGDDATTDEWVACHFDDWFGYGVGSNTIYNAMVGYNSDFKTRNYYSDGRWHQTSMKAIKGGYDLDDLWYHYKYDTELTCYSGDTRKWGVQMAGPNNQIGTGGAIGYLGVLPLSYGGAVSVWAANTAYTEWVNYTADISSQIVTPTTPDGWVYACLQSGTSDSTEPTWPDFHNGWAVDSQEVANGTFDADTDWTKGTGWTISAGVANASSATGDLEQTTVINNLDWYYVQLTVTRSAGSIVIKLGTTTDWTITESGTFSQYFKSNGTTFAISPDSSFTGTVDDVYVRQIQWHNVGPHYVWTQSSGSSNEYYLEIQLDGSTILPWFVDPDEYTLGGVYWGCTGAGVAALYTGAPSGFRTCGNYVDEPNFETDAGDWDDSAAGWAVSTVNERAEATSSNDTISQNINASNGTQYTLKYQITDYSAGTVTPYIGTAAGTGRTANGSYTDTITANGTDLKFTGSSSFTGKIAFVHVYDANAGVFATGGTIGSLSERELGFGRHASDSLNRDTVYIRLTNNEDPDTKPPLWVQDRGNKNLNPGYCASGCGDLVTDGDFTGDGSEWTEGANWTYDTTNDDMDAANASADVSQQISSVSGEKYQIEYDITAYTSGSVTPKIGAVSGDTVTACGSPPCSHIDYLEAAAADANLIFTGASFTGTIDNVVVSIAHSNTSDESFSVMQDIRWLCGVGPAAGFGNTGYRQTIVDVLYEDWLKVDDITLDGIEYDTYDKQLVFTHDLYRTDELSGAAIANGWTNGGNALDGYIDYLQTNLTTKMGKTFQLEVNSTSNMHEAQHRTKFGTLWSAGGRMEEARTESGAHHVFNVRGASTGAEHWWENYEAADFMNDNSGAKFIIMVATRSEDGTVEDTQAQCVRESKTNCDGNDEFFNLVSGVLSIYYLQHIPNRTVLAFQDYVSGLYVSINDTYEQDCYYPLMEFDLGNPMVNALGYWDYKGNASSDAFFVLDDEASGSYTGGYYTDAAGPQVGDTVENSDASVKGIIKSITKSVGEWDAGTAEGTIAISRTNTHSDWAGSTEFFFNGVSHTYSLTSAAAGFDHQYARLLAREYDNGLVVVVEAPSGSTALTTVNTNARSYDLPNTSTWRQVLISNMPYWDNYTTSEVIYGGEITSISLGYHAGAILEKLGSNTKVTGGGTASITGGGTGKVVGGAE